MSSTPEMSVSRRRFAAGALGAALSLRGRPGLAQAPLDGVRAACNGAVAELQRYAAKQNMRLSACFVDLTSGQPLAEAGAHEPQNPASNQKLLTLALALDRLGPNHRFTTALHGRSAAADSLSELVLRSNGDPELSLGGLEQLARGLAEQGVRRIDGDVWVDQSAFDDAWDPPGYEQQPDEWSVFRAPVSAVSVGGNTLTLRVLATTEGAPARAWLSPAGIATLSGEVLTTGPRGPQNVRFNLKPQGDELEALVAGRVPSGGNELSFARRIARPALAPGRVLQVLLKNHGIAVAGQLRLGGADVQAERVSLRSRTLAEMGHALGKHSDNFVAEMWLKALAANDKPGSSAAGARLIEDYLQRLGAFDAGSRVSNGSGLFDANRVSAWALTRVLVSVFHDPRIGPDFVATLSIGGLDGTLSQRFKAYRGERCVRAKTGSLASVTALSGYLLRQRAPLAFSLLLNGVNGKQVDARAKLDASIDTVLKAVAP
ncbi:MAG: D-alanyl-D-alanine carboxypeptidase/D-alanyl-D-alanine-endopeptidase [Polyangiaceae bacterium]